MHTRTKNTHNTNAKAVTRIMRLSIKIALYAIPLFVLLVGGVYARKLYSPIVPKYLDKMLSIPQLSGSTTPLRLPSAVKLTGADVGFAYGDNLVNLSDASLDKYLSDTKALGAHWVRFDVDWSEVQPYNSSTYNWANIDRIVIAANKYKLDSLPILTYTPVWARQESCKYSAKCAPYNSKIFANFGAAAAKRYSIMGVHTWEIWNEPNIQRFWLPAPNPTQYTKLLKDTASSIRSSDPNAIIVSGGLAELAGDSSDILPATYLSQIYANGGGPYFDVVADHPYTYPYPPSSGGNDGWKRLAELHSIMESRGDTSKKIWVTEFGAPTGGPGGTVGISSKVIDGKSSDHVSEALQTVIIADSIQKFKSTEWLGTYFIYSYKDLSSDQSSIENHFGVLRSDGSKKSSYTAIMSLLLTPRQ